MKPTAKDMLYTFFFSFSSQIMMPTVIDAFDQLPEDLRSVWLCVICPEGDRVLVVASHVSLIAV